MKSLVVTHNPRVEAALHGARNDPEAAAEVLRLAAEYIQRDSEMPPELRAFLCTAFMASMAKESPQDRNAELLKNLRLVKRGARRIVKVVDEFAIGKKFDELLKAGSNQKDASMDVSIEFDIGESTAIRIWQEWLAADEEFRFLDGQQDSNAF